MIFQNNLFIGYVSIALMLNNQSVCNYICFISRMSKKSFQELKKTQKYKRLHEFKQVVTSANDNKVNDILELDLPNQM